MTTAPFQAVQSSLSLHLFARSRFFPRGVGTDPPAIVFTEVLSDSRRAVGAPCFPDLSAETLMAESGRTFHALERKVFFWRKAEMGALFCSGDTGSSPVDLEALARHWRVLHVIFFGVAGDEDDKNNSLIDVSAFRFDVHQMTFFMKKFRSRFRQMLFATADVHGWVSGPPTSCRQARSRLKALSPVSYKSVRGPFASAFHQNCQAGVPLFVKAPLGTRVDASVLCWASSGRLLLSRTPVRRSAMRRAGLYPALLFFSAAGPRRCGASADLPHEALSAAGPFIRWPKPVLAPPTLVSRMRCESLGALPWRGVFADVREGLRRRTSPLPLFPISVTSADLPRRQLCDSSG